MRASLGRSRKKKRPDAFADEIVIRGGGGGDHAAGSKVPVDCDRQISDFSGGVFERGVVSPNQTPQRNAGSRPSSDDSSASETPSLLGPRG